MSNTNPPPAKGQSLLASLLLFKNLTRPALHDDALLAETGFLTIEERRQLLNIQKKSVCCAIAHLTPVSLSCLVLCFVSCIVKQADCRAVIRNHSLRVVLILHL